MFIDIRQSDHYAHYMQRIGWSVGKVGRWYAYSQKFPILGKFIKIQRISAPIPFQEIDHLRKKNRVFKIILEPNHESGISYSAKRNQEIQSHGFRESSSFYSPTKTIHIDLTAREEKIFERLSEAKQRAVRRALKNKIVIEESSDIDQFIALKKRQDFVFGFLLKKDLHALWQIFRPEQATLLLAQCQFDYSNNRTYYLAGVLLLFYKNVAYYWQAAATKEGKKLFAPTLLVWEALKLSKKRGCQVFDFEGVYDERFPKATKNWKGFTRFKEGFGGKEVVYPPPIVK